MNNNCNNHVMRRIMIILLTNTESIFSCRCGITIAVFQRHIYRLISLINYSVQPTDIPEVNLNDY